MRDAACRTTVMPTLLTGRKQSNRRAFAFDNRTTPLDTRSRVQNGKLLIALCPLQPYAAGSVDVIDRMSYRRDSRAPHHLVARRGRGALRPAFRRSHVSRPAGASRV